MRLIDADALLKQILETTNTGENAWMLTLLTGLVHDAPTVRKLPSVSTEDASYQRLMEINRDLIERNTNLAEEAQMLARVNDHLTTLCVALMKKMTPLPIQKHGHWISHGDGHYTCSCCRTPRHMNFVPNYCSECGARMDEEVKKDE